MNLKNRLDFLERRVKPRVEPKVPLGIALGVEPELFVEEYNNTALMAQRERLPGVPIKWNLLSYEEGVAIIGSAFYDDNFTNLSTKQLEALIELCKFRDGRLRDDINQTKIDENNPWFIIADFVRDGENQLFKANDKSLILSWAYDLVRNLDSQNTKVINCFEIYMGCKFDSDRKSFYQDPMEPNNELREYDTGQLYNTFELTRLRIVKDCCTNENSLAGEKMG